MLELPPMVGESIMSIQWAEDEGWNNFETWLTQKKQIK